MLPEQKVPSASHYIRSKPECLVHLCTPQLPHLGNENSAHFITKVLQGLHEGTVRVVITENENAVNKRLSRLTGYYWPQPLTAIPESLLKVFCLNFNHKRPPSSLL